MPIASKPTLKFALALIFGVPAGLYIGRTIANGQERGHETTRQPAKVEQVGEEDAETPPLDAQLRQRYRVAAQAFAKQVAGDDDERFVRVFERAYLLAESATLQANREAPTLAQDLSSEPSGLTLAQTVRRFEESRASPESILNDPKYVKSESNLIQDPDTVPRIVGGVDTMPGEFPDCVAIGSESRWCCTGTLITPDVVVTAGHCHAACASRVYLGLDTKFADPERVVKVKRAIRHEGYHKRSRDLVENDLTVLILERQVADVPPRRIAGASHIDAAPWCRLVGFGRTDRNGRFGYGRQRKVDVPIASASCDTAAADRYACFEGHEIVAGGGGKDSCGGDSGGPLFIRVDGKWYLAGATSRATREWRLSGRPCGEGGSYVRLDLYLDWIKQTVLANGGHWTG